MRKLTALIAAAVALSLPVSNVAAQSASPYVASLPNDSMIWSAYTNQGQCQRGPQGSRTCVTHVFCGVNYWFPQLSFDRKQAFGARGVAAIQERGSKRTICKVR